MFFKNKAPPNAGNPQYLGGVHPPVLNPGLSPEAYYSYNGEAYKLDPVRIPETVTSGFYEDDARGFSLNYSYKNQPDIGGGLNYSYDNYGLPLYDVCGPWMVAAAPIPPIGSLPLSYWQVATITSIGGLIPGQIISQPLLNPSGPGSGFDIYS